jgi:hypothetical protein
MLVKSIFASLACTALAAEGDVAATCGDLKAMYKDKACCGSPEKAVDLHIVPRPKNKKLALTNECAEHAKMSNGLCTEIGVPQAGADVTAGNQGEMATTAEPLRENFVKHGLCPVNVHWHLGAEHKSDGQYDASGKGPAPEDRRLADAPRQGHRCHHYNAADPAFTTEYKWQHCVGMKVGETYEVHWPHSKAGACGTPAQFQTPFYDGVFCRHSDSPTGDQINLLGPVEGGGDYKTAGGLSTRVGVEAQVFTIINDEDYYYPELMRGMIIDSAKGYGSDMAYYTGSTTGDSRNNNDQCSPYSPITWQVDRKCHLISASSFDKMCADMKLQLDDMTGDLHAHGARETVTDALTANNLPSPPPAP